MVDEELIKFNAEEMTSLLNEPEKKIERKQKHKTLQEPNQIEKQSDNDNKERSIKNSLQKPPIDAEQNASISQKALNSSLDFQLTEEFEIYIKKIILKILKDLNLQQ